MNPRFLAVSLVVVAACMLWMTGLIIGTAIRRRDLAMAVSAVIAGASLAAIFVNAGADLW